jgi:hypothetical protein
MGFDLPVLNRLRRFGSGVIPASLFTNAEPGVWYDPSDITTLFQDTAGTTPITAPGQTVALMRDKSGRGNNATQATAASQPTYGIVPLGGRRNLGLMTSFTSVTGTAGSQVPNATGWSNVINTGGTRTYVASSQFPGDQALDIAGVTVARNTIAYTITPLASTTYTVSFWIESVSGVNGFVSYAIGAQTSGQINDPTSTGRVSYNFTSTAAAGSVQIRFGVGASGNASGSIRISGIQVEVGSTTTAYQRVTTQFDVTETSVTSLSYLSFDGVDDGMVTSTITPGTDKAQVFTGVQKLSDAAQKIVAEMSATIASNAGAFALTAPNSAAANYNFSSKGTTQTDNVVTTYTAPITSVISGLGDIAGASNLIRVNGAQVGSVLTTQGTGNYLAYPLYIGRRGGTTLPFNGRIYSLIVRFGANLTAEQIGAAEAWSNSKTGAY